MEDREVSSGFQLAVMLISIGVIIGLVFFSIGSVKGIRNDALNTVISNGIDSEIQLTDQQREYYAQQELKNKTNISKPTSAPVVRVQPTPVTAQVTPEVKPDSSPLKGVSTTVMILIAIVLVLGAAFGAYIYKSVKETNQTLIVNDVVRKTPPKTSSRVGNYSFLSAH